LNERLDKERFRADCADWLIAQTATQAIDRDNQNCEYLGYPESDERIDQILDAELVQRFEKKHIDLGT
jgi:predicted metalloendopeptidase